MTGGGMALTAGIALIDLFDATDQVTSALPQDISDFLRRFSIAGHRSTRSPGAVIHHGTLQSIAEVIDPTSDTFDIGIGTLTLPLVNGGLPFQLSMTRATVPAGAGALEAGAPAWQLTIQLSEFILALNGLEPAIYVKEVDTLPRHLLRDPKGGPVRIIGSAAIRFTKAAGGGVSVDFADNADPLDPTLATGGVSTLTFSPPHFFFGSSQVGMTVGQLLFDTSESYSPQQIIDANQGPEWVGMLLREATVYAPRNLPLVGDLSGGVRDVLIGNPLGIQGQLELQFGHAPLNPDTFQFKQEVDGPNLSVNPGSTSRTVTLQGPQDADVTIHAGMTAIGTNPSWRAEWSFDGGPTTTGISATGSVRHGSVVRIVPIETFDGTDFRHPDVTFRFIAAGEGAEVGATIGGNSFANVIHLSGTVEDLNTVTLTATSSAANPANSSFSWELDAASIDEDGASLTLALPEDLTGVHNLKLREEADDDTVRLTHVRIALVEAGVTLVGTETGVFEATDPATAKDLSAVEATYDLSDYHSTAETKTQPEQAVLDSGSPAGVTVPQDALAQVTVTDPAVISAPEFDRHVQVLMKFEEDQVLGWGRYRPAQAQSASGEADLQRMLLTWANNYPGAEFIVIGRCDDIGNVEASEATIDSFNLALAKQRAAKGKALLTTLSAGGAGTTIAASRILTRGETSEWDAEPVRGDGLEDNPDIQPDDMPVGKEVAWQSDAIGDVTMYNGWLIKTLNEGRFEGWRNAENTDEEALRAGYRRVDIYAVGGTPNDNAISRPGVELVSERHRRSWVPANGRAPTPVVPSSPVIDYRVKLVVGWDSPTIATWKDAVPALVEAEFAWTPIDAPLPEFDGTAVPVSNPTEVLTVYAKWIHDSRTEFTRLTLGVRSDGDPNGLASTSQKQLTAALALGPMLLSGVDFDDDMIGSAARVAALGVGVGAAGSILKDDSQTTLISVEAEAETRALSDPGEDYQIKLTAEYTTTLHVDADLGVIQLQTATDAPLKIRYKDVGIDFDSSETGWDKIGFAYETNSMQIEDGGRWIVGGVLGELLRISEVAMGMGSLWIELRIAVGLEIGIVEISEAIIRMVFKDGVSAPTFELRGFVLKASIPAVLEGEGRLRIEDGGIIRAGIECDVIPLAAKGSAALALGKPAEIDPSIFMSLHLGVQFSTPIPLAQSGAALYGFKGMFGMNAGRDLPELDDPVQRELSWWNTAPDLKYAPDKGQYAIGLGVVAGTLPDASFAFSVAGMVVVSFPDPEVILGVDVSIISVPDVTASDERGSEATITGLVVIDDEAVTVAVSATYTIPSVLEIKLPFGAYFPYSGSGTYVRIGSDGVEGRAGEPVTVTLLPGTLDQSVWAYLMIEEGGLPSLGGDSRFSFDGFSVGFGAGWGIDWSAGPISLSASAKVLVGFGTNPLLIKGGVFFAGELDLVVVSISANGELILTYIDEDVYLEGKVCGEVDLFFFSIEGCVGVAFGDPLDEDATPPKPEAPIAAVLLTDRKGRIMGQASTSAGAIAGNPLFAIDENGVNTGSDPKDNQVIWPDTAPVIQFKHYIKNEVPETQFDISATPSQPIWFGGNRLKYTYRVNDIRLVRSDGTPVEAVARDHLVTTWDGTPYKAEGSDGTDGNPLPSEHEGPNLRLLDWNPWTWVVNTTNGGEDTNGDPASEIEDICDPKPQPRHACVYGRAAVPRPWYAAELRQETPAEAPYPSRFFATGRPVLRMGSAKLTGQGLQTFVNAAGASILPGRVMDLPYATAVNGQTLSKGYRMPWAETANEDGFSEFPLPWEATFDRALTQPSIRLMICEDIDVSEEKNCVEFKGKKTTGKKLVIEHDKYVFRPMIADDPLRLTDAVDTSGNSDTPGRDGTAEISIPERGMTVQLRTPCTQLELWFMRFSDSRLQVKGIAADGTTLGPIDVQGPIETPSNARLSHPSGVVSVNISGASGKDVLYRLCCLGEVQPTDPKEKCETFRKLKPTGVMGNRFVHNGVRYKSVDSSQDIMLFDQVNQSVSPPRRGQDGSGELQFPMSGMKIELPEPCQAMSFGIMVFNDNPVRLRGFDASGREVATAIAPITEGIPHRVELTSTGGPISVIIVSGGGNEALLFRICCVADVPTGETDPCERFRNLAPQGDLGEVFSHNGFDFRSVVSGQKMILRDDVDQSVEPPRRGADGAGEIGVPRGGMEVKLPKPCPAVSLGVMVFHPEPLIVEAFDASGRQVAKVEAPTTQSVAHQVQLISDGAAITRLVLSGGGFEALLFRICCHENVVETPAKETCITLNTKIDGKEQETKIEAITAISLDRRQGLISTNLVNAKPDPAKPGKDRKQELGFPDAGVRLVLPDACDRVRVKVMQFGGPVKAVARSSDGEILDRDATQDKQSVEHVLTFSGRGIEVIDIMGGSGEAVIYEICCLPSKILSVPVPVPERLIDPRTAAPTTISRQAQTPTLPQVRGIRGGALADTWQGTLIETRRTAGRRCYVVEYRPRVGAPSPWSGVQVQATRRQRIWTLSICGVDQVMQDARDLDEARRKERIDELTAVLGTAVFDRREVLLEPGEDYRLEIDWEWSYWRSNEDGTNAPPSAPAPTAWEPGGTETYHFRVADTVADPNSIQDGLNEYIFDARDIGRYLTAVEPVDGRTTHFTDDPVWVHFDNGHVKNLLDQYDTSLDIVVRRTDPPPQSEPTALAALLSPLLGVPFWSEGPTELEPTGYQRIEDAIIKAPCLPEGKPGGASYGSTFDLEPRSMYDFELHATPTSGAPAVVSATRFLTSRYANPREMLTHMGYGETEAAVFGPDDLILPTGASLPSGSLETSDALLDAMLEDIDAATLPLPSLTPETYALWRLNGTTWQIEGLLIDALESLNRTITQRDATKAVIAPRCVLSSGQIGVHSITPVRASTNWTRVLMVPAAPITLTEGKHDILLSFTTNGASLTGRRVIGHQPSLIQREGF